MLNRRAILAGAGAALLTPFANTDTAQAHISIVGELESRNGDQKQSPCDGEKGDGPVYTFAPGSVITIEVDEVIPHPSYYRIAFDDDGDDGFVEPASIKPIDPNRAGRGQECLDDPNDKCGESDFCNVVSTDGPTVLWDNVAPHLSSGAKKLTWNLKLPDIECDNCTIQILQVMEDTIHGAYCPQGSCSDLSLEDIYHRCIDVKLVRGAADGPGTTTEPENLEGISCLADQNPPATDAGADADDAGAAPDAATSRPDAGVDAGGGASVPEGSARPRDAGAGSTPPRRDAGRADDDDAQDEEEPEDDEDEKSEEESEDDASDDTEDDDENADEDDKAPRAEESEGCSLAQAGGGNASGLALTLSLAWLVRMGARRRRGCDTNDEKN